jgi:SpoVK/Ycf46/Vps4 family AAA+-type ATPase
LGTDDLAQSTNELLQGLDRLRKRPNVVFICTSNLIDNIDSAFVDRCGIEQCVGTPSVECAYGIFRSVINELIKTGLVFFDPADLNSDTCLRDLTSSSPSQRSTYVQSTQSNDTAFGHPTYLPELEWVDLHLFDRVLTAPWELRRIAAEADGLSGRTLRRLPMLAMTKYTVNEPCDMRDLLVALRRVVKEKNNNRSKEDGNSGKPNPHLSEEDQETSDQLNEMSLDDLFPSSNS